MPRMPRQPRAISRNACRAHNTGTCRSKARPKRQRLRESWNFWRRRKARTHFRSRTNADLSARCRCVGLSRLAIDEQMELHARMMVSGTADGHSAEWAVRTLESRRENKMNQALKALGATVLFAATASIAGAAPARMGHTPEGLSNDVIQVHGYHRSCQRGPGGWHRHNREGDWRPCRQWD